MLQKTIIVDNLIRSKFLTILMNISDLVEICFEWLGCLNSEYFVCYNCTIEIKWTIVEMFCWLVSPYFLLYMLYVVHYIACLLFKLTYPPYKYFEFCMWFMLYCCERFWSVFGSTFLSAMYTDHFINMWIKHAAYSFPDRQDLTEHQINTVKVFLFVCTNICGFFKMHWSMGSWICGFKHYRQQSIGKLYVVGFLFLWFKWTKKSVKIRTPWLIMIA